MADELLLIDGTQTIVEDHPGGRLYELAARVEGACSRSAASQIGPALNALYAQALAAVLVDPSLGGLAVDVREGAIDGPAVEMHISHRPFTSCNGEFAINLFVPFWQNVASASKREPILGALTAALTANVPTATLSVRERVIAAFRTQLETALGFAVLRNADRPADCTAGTPIVILGSGDQTADYSNLGMVIYRAHAAVEVFVPGNDTTVLDGYLQTILGAVHTSDHLGGVAIDVVERDADPDVLRQEYTHALLAGRVDVDLIFATATGNPYQVVI